MLTSFREIFAERRAARAAVGAFTCYDVTMAIGVVRAAEARGDPGLLLSTLHDPAPFLLVDHRPVLVFDDASRAAVEDEERPRSRK